MLKKIELPALKFWSNPNAAEDIINKFNEVVDTVNQLTLDQDNMDKRLIELDGVVYSGIELSPEDFDS